MDASSLITAVEQLMGPITDIDRKSTRLNSSHLVISYAVFCLKKKLYRWFLSQRDKPQRTGASRKRFVPNEGADDVGYSTPFADCARLGTTQHTHSCGNRCSG